jgi:hypothetical protein
VVPPERIRETCLTWRGVFLRGGIVNTVCLHCRRPVPSTGYAGGRDLR